MPEENLPKEKTFFDKLNEAKDKVETPNTFSQNNLTGITSANSRTAMMPQGHYKDLHEEVGVDLFSNAKNWEKLGYSEQSTLDVVTNTFFGGITNFAAGFLEGIASNDLKGMYDMSLGNTEKRYGNILHEWANDLMEYSQDNFHIYDGGDNSPFSFEYWGKQLQNTGYSVGIIAEMFAEQALLAAATRGSGNAASAATLGKRYNLLKKIPQILQKNTVFGSYQGIKEAYMNGLQTGEETYRKYKDIGFNDQEAKKRANEAATLGFRMEVLPLMTLNALQFAALGRFNPFKQKVANQGFSGGFETLSDYAFKKVNNKFAKKALDYGVNIVSEGIEEGIQTGISKEAYYQTALADDIVGKKDFIDRWFDDDEMRDSIIGGAIGGGFFRFMGKRVNNLTQGTKIKQQKQEYDEFLTNVANRIKEDTKDLQEAIDSGNQDKVDIVRKRMQRNNVYESLKMDLMNQKEDSFESYIATLNQMKEAAEKGNLEMLKEFGITEVSDINLIKENFDTYINDAVDIKEKLIANLNETNDVNAALQLTHLQKTTEELEDFRKRSIDKAKQSIENDSLFNQLTEKGKQKLNLELEKMALQFKAKEDSLTEEQKSRLDNIQEQLNSWNENNKEYEGKESDNSIINNVNISEYLSNMLTSYQLEDYKRDNIEKISYWKKKKNQKKERIKRAEQKIKKSKSKEALVEAKESLQQEGNIDKNIEEHVNAKVEEIEVKEQAHPQQNKTPFVNQDNPFGEIVKPSEEDLKVSEERGSIGKNILEESGIAPQEDAIVVDPESLFEPADINNISSESLNKITSFVSDYYESLKSDLGKNPTFTDFVKDFIKNNGRDNADRIYNALVEAWKNNNYSKEDYEAIYNEVFRDRKNIGQDIINVAEDIIQSSSKEEVAKENNEELEEVVNRNSEVVELDENSQPKIIDNNPFRTSSPTLKAAHLSIPYKREIVKDEEGVTIIDEDTSEELLNSEDINSNKLLIPERYNKGEVLEVRIPDNYKEIRVAVWEDAITKAPSITFGEWEERLNNDEFFNLDEIGELFEKAFKEKNDKSGLVEVSTVVKQKDGILSISFEVKNNNKKGEERTQSRKTYNTPEELIKDLGITDKETISLIKDLGQDSKDFSVREIRSDLKGKNAATLTIGGETIDVEIGNFIDKYNQQKWQDKVPMIAYDKQGEGVFFVHDTDWYNPINLGFKDDLEKQNQLIKDSKYNLREVRNRVSTSNNLAIEITEKRPGTWKSISKDQQPITLNEANPDTIIGIANDQGEIIVGNKIFEIDGIELINTKEFQRGHTYDIREVSKNKYVAFEVMRDNINSEVINTVYKVIESYLYKYDSNNLVSNNEQNNKLRRDVLNVTGLDIHDVADFENFLNLYIPTVKGKFSTVEDILNTIEGNNNIPNGTPYMSIQKGSLVFGIKGANLSKNNKILYVHPKRINDEGGAEFAKSILKSFKPLLEKTTQHISKKGLEENRKTITINENNEVIPSDNYNQYLKNNLKTTIKSFDVGTKENPIYATIIQPVINYKISDKDYDKEEIVKEKQNNNEPLTKKEELLKEEKGITEDKQLDSSLQQSLLDSLEILKELGVPKDDPNYVYILEQLGLDSDYSEDFSTDYLEGLSSYTPSIDELTILQEFQIVDHVFNQITSKLDFKYKSAVSKKDLLKEIKDSYFSLIEPKQEKVKSTINNLQKIFDANPNEKMASLINKLREEVKIFNVIKSNWTLIENKALDKVFKYTGITESTMKEETMESSSTQVEKNYSKSSLEENGKTTASYRLKRFFSGIKQVNSNGKQKLGYLGVETYVGFDTVYSTIEQIISSPFEVDSDFDLMITRLEDNKVNFKWLDQVITELKEADQQIKNEFVYNFARHTLSMKFVMFSKNRDGSYTLKTYDTNANEITRVIRNQWESNFKQSPLTFVDEGVYSINKERAKILLQTYNEWKKQIASGVRKRKQSSPVNIKNSELQNWLLEFGISLSDETINELKNKPLIVNTSEGPVKINFSQMFENSANTNGIFGLLGNYLETIVKRKDVSFEENPDNHPFNNATNVLKTLSKIESKYSTFATTNSFRDGDKSIYGFTPTKHATDIAKRLMYDEEFKKQLSTKSFNKHSYMLKLLNSNPAFRNKFYIDHIGITAIKELGKKVFGSNEITSLNNSDHELTKLGFFQDTEQGEVKGYLGDNNFVDLRMARVFLPTMSDKSQMLTMYTAILNLKNKHFQIDENNNFKLEEQLKEILYSQLVKPELERIHNFVSTIKKTNIKGYDAAAQMFLMIPEINNLLDSKTKKRVISLIINSPDVYNIEWFENTVKKEVLKLLENLVTTEVNNKINLWEESGFIEKDENDQVIVKFFNKKYLDRFQGKNSTKIKLAAYDFVINSMLSNANSFMLLAGDLANYSQDKIKSYFQDGKVYLPKEEFGNSVYSKVVKDIISVNVGKRLALLLAPGNKLANSKNSKYIQVFLEDFIDISSNILSLIKLFYGELEEEEATEELLKYNKETDINYRRKIAKDLSKKYPEIADYFDIEATDAQEYTTLSEHINILYNQGRLGTEQYNTILDKINQQTKAELKGENIPNSSILSYEELKLVLQPIKPVHTGFKNEDRFDNMRIMYIKSSAFPLMPQVTKGTQLDDLRKNLERLEAETGKNVRASYQTANKVGAVTTAISPFNANGTYNSNLTLKDYERASLVLDRDNFRIQQDVPFKSDKRRQDTVSLGTQTLKLLFGDGITALKGFQYNGEILDGQALMEKFNQNFVNYIEHRKQTLYKQLGVDENGKPKDLNKTMKMLQNLLIREATERGYPKQDIEALKLSPVTNNQGEIIDLNFTIPIWLSPNSNRYEALLNAIVSNRLVNVKIPGNSFVVGSEAGFKLKSNLEGINQSKIVYTKDYEGELKAAEFNRDGSLKKAQILVPSKFRDNEGKLIQLINPDGTYNSVYVEKNEQGQLIIKENSIAQELMSITSFRIPTSGHVSMSQLEIVGFLPTEVGDLMIVPRNLTKQKGLDFDIDKETTYQLHTFIDLDNNIVVLEEKHRQEILKIADRKNTSDWNDNSPESNLLKAIFGEDPDFILEELDENSKIDKINDQITQKLMENEFVKIHNSVLSNPNREVQKKINKVLSMDFAKGQAELVQNILEENVDNTHFSVLSDEFQKNKMELGASGKLGIGVYSNYVVFHSMLQQTTNPVYLSGKDLEGKEHNLIITIGNQRSDGTLGRQTSLAPDGIKRNLAEVFAERQNTATDNEKEQIMGRLNINEVTINVDSLLSLLGFDKGLLNDGKEVSIPYLLLSQPIIKDYVNEIRKTKSNTVEFDSSSEMKVIAKLKEKYFVDVELEDNKQYYDTLLTPQTLFDNLKSENSSNLIQNIILEKFLELDGIARKISAIQNRLNINREGLGKSFFDTIDKYYSVINFKENYEESNNISLKNISSLIGDYVYLFESEESRESLRERGYLDFNDYMIKPTTPVGAMLLNSVKSGFDLWKDYFPYADYNIEIAARSILEEISNENTSEQKLIALKQGIFKDLKKYLFTSSKLGVFEGSPKEKRYELFIDNNENTSLAKYLKELLNNDRYDFLKNNKLLSRFQFSLNKNGVPSTIKFDNTKGENFDEDYLYVSIIELIDENLELPSKNNKPYNTRKLAQDLVAYSYLEGGIQEAIQFVKYIPVHYLNAVGFGETSRKWSNIYFPDFFAAILGLNTQDDSVSRFAKQYIQHNPQRLNKVNPETDISNVKYSSNKQDLSDLESFELDEKNLNPERFNELVGKIYISIYNPKIKKGLNKFQIYEFDGKRYNRISTLGVFGMSEYDVKANEVTSLVNDNFKDKKPINVSQTEKNSVEDIFSILTGNISDIVKEISEYNFETNKSLADVAALLSSNIPNNLKIEVKPLVNSRGDRIARGKYQNNIITIDDYHFRTAGKEEVAKTFIHELIHSMTTSYVSTYIDKQGKYLTQNTPKEIIELVILFNEVKNKLGPEVDNYLQKRKDQLEGNTREGTTERERTVVYAGTNIREFITLVMTEPNFQKEMDKVNYKKSDKTLWDKFSEIVNNILKSIFGENYNSNSVTAGGIKAVLDIVEKQKQISDEKNIIDESLKNDSEIETLLRDSAFGAIIRPTQEDFESSDELAIFDPFICK